MRGISKKSAQAQKVRPPSGTRWNSNFLAWLRKAKSHKRTWQQKVVGSIPAAAVIFP
jgi:hypothetical protein